MLPADRGLSNDSGYFLGRYREPTIHERPTTGSRTTTGRHGDLRLLVRLSLIIMGKDMLFVTN